jgi:hypothetical protein
LPVNSGNAIAFVPGPKASLIFGPFAKTEFYINGGQGFHSNDIRGVTIKVEPTSPSTAWSLRRSLFRPRARNSVCARKSSTG